MWGFFAALSGEQRNRSVLLLRHASRCLMTARETPGSTVHCDVSTLKYLVLGERIKPPPLSGSAGEENRVAVVFAQAELMTVFWFRPWKTNCRVILVKTPRRRKNSGFPVSRLVIFHNKRSWTSASYPLDFFCSHLASTHFRLLHLNRADFKTNT